MSKENTPTATLETLAKAPDWDSFLEKVVHVKDAEIWLDVFSKLLWRIDAPCNIIEAFVCIAGRNFASRRYETGSTPLHEAIYAGANATVIRKLVAVFPEGVASCDSYDESPLDILSRKIIMIEEITKYACETRQSEEDCLWECARLMLTALSGQKDDEPLLHVVIYAGSRCPESLRTRAFRKFPSQLTLANAKGDLPIHISAGMVPTDPEEDDLLGLIEAAPGTIMSRNTQNLLSPLQIAEKNGRTWRTGIHNLIRAEPQAIESLQLDFSIYPFILRKCAGSVIYQILRGKPPLSMV